MESVSFTLLGKGMINLRSAVFFQSKETRLACGSEMNVNFIWFFPDFVYGEKRELRFNSDWFSFNLKTRFLRALK